MFSTLEDDMNNNNNNKTDMAATVKRSVSKRDHRATNAIQFIEGIVQIANDERKEAQIGDLDSQKIHIYSEAFRGNHLPLFANAIATSQQELLKVMINEFFHRLQKANFKGKVGMSWNDYLRPQIICLVNEGDWDAETLVYKVDASVNAKLTDFGMKLDTIVLEAPQGSSIPEDFTEIIFNANV